MNAKLLIPFVAATLFSLPAHALDCSGGANGGMDATGNDCSSATTVATVVSYEGAKAPSGHSPKVAANKLASYSGSAVKRTAATRHTSKVKHG